MAYQISSNKVYEETIIFILAGETRPGKFKEDAMDKFIPISKKTKKQQKEYYSKHRNTWNGLNPVTRIVPNGKGYDRNKQKQQDRRSGRLSYNQDSTCRFCYV